jgi:cardiolipin synthase
VLNPANLLSAARLAVAPFAVEAIVHGAYTRALVIFAIAGFTDALDGVLARRFGWVTSVGAFLDPIADKVLLTTSYLSMGAAGLVPWWLVAIVIGRDAGILIVVGLIMMFSARREFAPSAWGKVSTLVQVCVGVSVIGERALSITCPCLFNRGLIALVAAATSWSGLHYAWQAQQWWRTAKKIPPGARAK